MIVVYPSLLNYKVVIGMVSFESVSKSFGNNKSALSDVSLNVPKGMVVGIIGTSGAGKTTFVKLASGLLEPTLGRVRVMLKEPVKNRKVLCAKIGVFMANISLLQRNDTVIGNFQSLRHIFRLTEKQFKTDYDELSLRLGFYKFQDQIVSQLSLGQRMRVELGAILIHRPALLILDEPTVGLDENAKTIFREIIAEKNRGGVTVIITSHDMTQASCLCERLALFDRGHLLCYGSENQIRNTHMPIDTMTLTVMGKLPDLQDLPLRSYTIVNNTFAISYNTNYISSTEILRLILQQTTVSEVKILKPSLADIIAKMQKGAT